MTEARCENCRFMHAAVIGIVECSFAPDGFMDRIRRECRRFPPVPSFWGDRFPTAGQPCGEHQPAPARQDGGK